MAAKKAAAAPAPSPLADEIAELSKLTRALVQGQNDALTTTTSTLERTCALNKGLTEQLAAAMERERQLTDLMAQLQRGDLEREKFLAEIGLLRAKHDAEAAKWMRVVAAVESAAKVVVGTAALPMALGATAAAEGDAETNGGDNLVALLVDVLQQLSPATQERIRAEAGDKRVEKLLRAVMAHAEQAKPKEAEA